LKKIAIVSHDAGGAEVLSSWLKYQDLNYLTVIDGPALNIYKKKGIKNTGHNLREAIIESDIVITSTSWQTELEKEAIYLSKKMNKYVITLLDHWVNYLERFKYKGKFELPDEIWVTDKYARKIAEENFKDLKIKQINNFYLDNIKSQINKKNIFKNNLNSGYKGLFIGENISDHYVGKKIEGSNSYYNENQALKYLLDNLCNLEFDIKELKIRPHPSDMIGKYEWALENKYVKSIENKNDLIDDICRNDIIFGCESMAMVVGLIAKKKVVCCIPLDNKKSSLPFPNIIKLRDLIVKID